MSIDEVTEASPVNGSALPSRRSLLKIGGSAALGLGAYALAACNTSNSSPGTTASAQTGSSVLDKWTSSKTANLGVDLTFPPIQFKDASGKPAGYQMDITNMLMADLGVTPNYIESPFGQLFASVVSGRIDMMGISATILPSRALKGLFANFPVFYESIVIILKPGSTISSPSQLNNSNITITTVQGTAQEAAGKLLYPKATSTSFTAITDSINAVATKKADAVILSEFDVGSAFAAHPDLRIMPGPPLFSDANTYFMPLNDFKLQAFVTDWLRYYATHQTLAGLWEKYVGPDAAKYNLRTNVVGAGGEAVPVQS
jgi:polar amino acid transport system substrate-binding protein